MRFIIALTISMTYAFVSSFWLAKKGIVDKGQYRCEQARKRGDVTEATLMSQVRYDAETTGDRRYNGEYFDCEYSYMVDGKEYKFRHCFAVPEDTIEICYDRNRGNKWIDPERKGLGEYLWALSIPALFFFLCVKLYTNY